MFLACWVNRLNSDQGIWTNIFPNNFVYSPLHLSLSLSLSYLWHEYLREMFFLIPEKYYFFIQFFNIGFLCSYVCSLVHHHHHFLLHLHHQTDDRLNMSCIYVLVLLFDGTSIHTSLSSFFCGLFSSFVFRIGITNVIQTLIMMRERENENGKI